MLGLVRRLVLPAHWSLEYFDGLQQLTLLLVVNVALAGSPRVSTFSNFFQKTNILQLGD